MKIQKNTFDQRMPEDPKKHWETLVIAKLIKYDLEVNEKMEVIVMGGTH